MISLRPLRRWFRHCEFRFSLRTLFVAMTLIAVLIVFWLHKPAVVVSYEKFVEEIKAKRFPEAYQMLTPAYQRQQSYANFVKHYSRWGPPREPISTNYTAKDLGVVCCHVPGDPDKPSTNYHWKRIDGTWRLDRVEPYLWMQRPR
jgi:hypothetical protein